MKITQIAGFLGCGKTTLLLKLSKQLADDGERKVALVVNEIGEIPVDGKVMEESGMQVKDIGGGCICCEVASTFAKTIYRLYKDFKPDHVLVEPTGVAVPHQVKLAARMGGRDAKISIGPAIVLFDATRPAELLDMDMLGQLVTTQIKDADVIAISKVDAVDDTAVSESAEKVRDYNAKANIFNLSSFTGIGLDQLADTILAWEA
ncbi:MAG: GTP-binding protein [Desulfobacterales bacterium]|nr:GTP-binding protein [Desulfobacterales bacterium]